MSTVKYLILLSLLLLLLVGFGSCSSAFKKNLMKNIQPVDLEKYAGRWYEIARYPHRFERNLTGVTADYTLLDNGRIEVINRGFEDSLNGKERIAIGKAKSASNDGMGHLKVSFFWIFYADYFILELDPDYQHALIGSSSSDFLWVLSRTPQMPEDQLETLLARARTLGYDLEKVERVLQPEFSAD